MTMNLTMPCEREAEEAVLGAMLLAGGDLVGEILPMLAAKDFYDAAHEKIWAAMQEVNAAGLVIDLLTVAERMRTNRTMAYLAARGDEIYLSNLANSLGYTGNAADHAKLVRETSTLRKLAALGDKIRDQAMKRTRPAAELLSLLQGEASAIADATIDNPVEHIKPTLNAVINVLAQREKTKQAITGVPSGLTDLDEKTGGYQPTDLIIIAARPSMGKTAKVTGNILHAAEKRIPTLFFSIEMSKRAITERAISNNGHIDGTAMRNGFLTAPDWVKIFGATSRLSAMPIYFDDSGYQTLATISTKSRKWRRDKDIFPTGEELGLIAIDYLQLIKSPDSGKFTNRDREIGMITTGLKALAKELRVPVIALSQLNRSLESRADKRPMCSDLRESGSIEQDADLILFLYRDEKYNKESEDKGKAEIIIGKQRNGPTGTVMATFIEHETRFADLSRRSGY